MTPPDTNLKKQRRRHRPALYAIAFAVFFGILTLLLRVFDATDPDDTMLDAEPTLREPLDQGQPATD
jgi:hypothetical protein